MINQVIRKFCTVNKKLLPFKVHFFFTFGAYSSMLNFMPIIGKEIGINVTGIGIVYSTLHLLLMLSNPITGLLVDYFQTIKIFLMVLLISSVSVYSSVLSLPRITENTENLGYIQVFQNGESKPILNITTPYKKTCLEELLKSDMQCSLRLEKQISDTFNNTNKIIYDKNIINLTHNALNSSDPIKKGPWGTYWLNFYVTDQLQEIKDKIDSVKAFQCSPAIDKCSASENFTSVFSAYQFWLFFTFIIIGGMTSSSAMNLSSVACNEVLDHDSKLYGRQRLFGTIACGVMCTLSGVFNDTIDSKDGNFLSSLFLMVIFMTIAVINLSFMNLSKSNMSTSMCRDLGKIISSKQILVFSFAAIFIGIFQSVPAVYEFWFLEGMGANRTLLGLTIFMQCIIGEVPFLFFSGWFVQKLGHYLCICGVFVGFTVRFALYSILGDPWFALPIDILHGVTYGLYHGAMVSFAKVKSPTGLEATLLTLLGGLTEGLGCSIGSFVSGFGVDKLGARQTFFITSMISLGCFVLFLMAAYFFRSSRKDDDTKDLTIAQKSVNYESSVA